MKRISNHVQVLTDQILNNQKEPYLKVMVIGLGTHALRGHIDHFKNCGIQLIAAVDTNKDARIKFKQSYSGDYRLGESYKEFITDPDIEAVFIMTPDQYHAQQTLDCLKAGKHVFCEKPMADESSINLLYESINIAKENNLTLTSCHPRRYDPPFEWLKHEIKNLIFQLGVPLEFKFDFSYAKPTKFGLHSGLLADHLNHEIDLLHFLFDACSFLAYKLIDAQDRYLVSGIRSDGLAFSFGGTRMLDTIVYPETCWIRFAQGEITLNAHLGSVCIWNHCSGKKETILCGATNYSQRFKKVNLNFKKSIQGLESNYLTFDDLMINTLSGVHLTEKNSWEWEK